VRRDREPLFLTLLSENAGRQSGTAVEVAGFDETFSRRTEVAMATISLTKTVTVNAAFLQEIKEVHQELWKLLEEIHYICSRPLSIHQSARILVDKLSQLRDQLALHFALEEAYGYFEDPVFVDPRLSEKAGQLRQEHRKLYQKICQLVDYAEHLHYRGEWASWLTRVSLGFHAFHEQLQVHESMERELIMDAYQDDIGVGD
jgi:hypothetical protein